MAHPLVEDICDLVAGLPRDEPIQDDHPDLHRLCTQLERLLRIDRRDKSSFFSSQKGIWEYFCEALASGGKSNDAIIFVKRHQEVKTSEGRGRAFIRFCLASGCLADTLQQCLLNQQITNDWFGPLSPLQQPLQRDLFLHALYDLSGVVFLLGPPSDQLDAQWPLPVFQQIISPEQRASLAENNASSSCGDYDVPLRCESLHVPVCPASEDCLPVKNDSPLPTPSIPSTEDSNAIPLFQAREKEQLQFIKLLLGKIVELQLKLDKFGTLKNGQATCAVDLDSMTKDFRDELETMHTAILRAIHNRETPVCKASTTSSREYFECQPTERTDHMQEKLVECETRCRHLEERHKLMKDAVSAANLVVSQETQKILQLRSQMDGLKQNSGATLDNDSKIVETVKINEKHFEIVNEKLRKMLTLVAMQQDQIEILKVHLDKLKEEKHALILQLDKLQKVMQRVETITGNKQCFAPEVSDPQFVPEQEPQLEAQKKEDELAEVKVLGDQPPTIASVSKTLNKLHCFIKEKLDLEHELESAKEITSSLMNKVAEQEQKLSNVTMELSDTRHFVSKLQTAFSKLQTNESILRYELREKRRIFNALKLQLEGSRAEWKQIQQKNTVSLLEWQNLRDEFASRQKQDSEESGYSEDGTSEAIDDKEELNRSNERACDGATAHPDILVDINRTAGESGDDGATMDRRGRRLKLLEEQCKLLCKKLMKSAVHCAKLDSKLTSLHDQYGTPDTKGLLLNQFEGASTSPENVCEEIAPIYVNTATEESALVVEDMLDDLLSNIGKVGNAALDLDPQNQSVLSLSPAADRLDYAECDTTNCATSLPLPTCHHTKPSAFTLAHALPKRVEKLKQEKEEMQQVLLKMQNERDIQEKRESMLLAQIEELQSQKKENHSKSAVTIEHLQAQLIQMTNQLHDERLSKQQLQEEVKQVRFGREQMEAEIQQLQIANEKLQSEVTCSHT